MLSAIGSVMPGRDQLQYNVTNHVGAVVFAAVADRAVEQLTADLAGFLLQSADLGSDLGQAINWMLHDEMYHIPIAAFT